MSESDASGNGVALRPYDPTDEADAIELWRRSWQTAYPEIDFSERLDWWRERWRSDTVVSSSIVVAQSGDEIVGFVTVNGRTGYLDQLVVAPEAWGTPTAVLLLDRAKRESPRGLDLHVNVDNARALRFYEKHGFERVSESINPRSSRPVYLMRWLP